MAADAAGGTEAAALAGTTFSTRKLGGAMAAFEDTGADAAKHRSREGKKNVPQVEW